MGMKIRVRKIGDDIVPYADTRRVYFELNGFLHNLNLVIKSIDRQDHTLRLISLYSKLIASESYYTRDKEIIRIRIAYSLFRTSNPNEFQICSKHQPQFIPIKIYKKGR